ncbi:hypothetical protein [Variovorax sp. PAMC 28711]|uniref:hypothetical protein n=1 Tax=Variovorax sp. PAMC 28711 TaxID=1795631 RepID=UPI00078E8BC0|nr:hypothetical protein [Variovorax sp. PAMC 28711]AMM23196.1 hypothetical protein AX767_01500 [Variovorax sp. PAMC 28711]
MATDNFTAIDTELDALRKVMRTAPAEAAVLTEAEFLEFAAHVSRQWERFCASGRIKSETTRAMAAACVQYVEHKRNTNT